MIYNAVTMLALEGGGGRPKMKQRGESWISGENETVVFTATIERSTSFEADVPSYPTENGYEVADSIIKKPMELSVKGRIKTYSEISTLEMLYAHGAKCLYHSPNYEHANVVIQRMSVREHAEVGNEWEVELSLKQVISVTTRIREIVEQDNVTNAQTKEEQLYTQDFAEWRKAVEQAKYTNAETLAPLIYTHDAENDPADEDIYRAWWDGTGIEEYTLLTLEDNRKLGGLLGMDYLIPPTDDDYEYYAYKLYTDKLEIMGDTLVYKNMYGEVVSSLYIDESFKDMFERLSPSNVEAVMKSKR